MAALADTGHHNCRDYHLPLPRPATHHTLPPLLSQTQTTAAILRLHATQKSPLNAPVKHCSFPFLRLPYELRCHIYSYLLPYTETKRSSGSLVSVPKGTSSAASTAHKIHLASLPAAKYAKDTTLWHRGQTSLLSVNSQLHAECAELLYGENVFVLWVAYDSIGFRFRWVLASGLAPSHTHDFLQLLGKTRYLGLIKKAVVTVDYVDEYTGMIKYNVGAKGLTYGLRLQVRKLVRAMTKASDSHQEKGLRKLTVTLLNGNEVAQNLERKGIVRLREQKTTSEEEIQEVLEPLKELTGLTDLTIHGSVTEEYKDELRKKIMALSGEL